VPRSAKKNARATNRRPPSIALLPNRHILPYTPRSFPILRGKSPSGLGFQFIDVVPLCAKNGLTVAAQPTVELSGVDAAEVGMELQVASVEVGQAGVLATTPPLTEGPATNKHEAAPWSVPRLPFSCTRRPNSEKVISRTRLS
jgi:hypothetical protein